MPETIDGGEAGGGEGKWVLIPFPDPVAQGLAWHYTDASGLLGIVGSHGLWASASAALNDTSELRYGEDVVRRTWATVRAELPLPCQEFVDKVLEVDLTQDMQDNVFILSASLDGDLLNQWQHYARRGGFAVGIDISLPLAPRVNPAGATQETTKPGPIPGWNRVVYAPAEQADWARKMLIHTGECTPGGPTTWQEQDNLDIWPQMIRSCRLVLQTLICQFKNPAFEAEREVRFLATAVGQEPYERFRATPDGRIAPYVVLGSALPGGAVRVETGGPLPIREVICGPSSDLNAEDSVRRMLRASGYKDVAVRSSAVPYR
jgi:hypothetical protein